MGDTTATAHITGIVLAAGAGTRMGMPKALMRTPDGEPWLARATQLLAAAGCERILVVLGARAEDALPLVRPGAVPVMAADWAEGMSASLRAGLDAATGRAALITLVDIPDMPLSVVRRVLGAGATDSTLRQATYNGRPGHPVVVGRDHWDALVADLAGDRGARRYLAAHGVNEVECSDLFDGQDVDRPVP